MTFLIIGLLITILYISIVCASYKCIPPSVSETYYIGGGIWFTITLFVSSILIMMGLLNLTEGSNWQFISFLTAAGMALVGASPKFHDSEKTVHYIGAGMLLTGSLIWIAMFSNPWILLSWLTGLIWMFSSKRIFWIEILCIFTMILSMFI